VAKTFGIRWLEGPEDHDLPAAASYLALAFDDKAVQDLVRALRKTKPREFKAKDIFRASGLSLLGVSNSHVAADQAKIKKGKALSPILLVRDTRSHKLIIADGYHRLCAVYSFSEDAVIPCVIVSAPP